METAVFWIWLQQALGVGAHQSEALLQTFETAQTAYEAACYPDSLALTKTQLRRLADKDLTEAAEEYKRVKEHGAWLLTPEDPLYAALFEGMYAPPVVLYAKGAHLDVKRTPSIAIVGTRHHNEAGERATRKLAAGLAAAGVTIISGGAEGLDSVALEAALNENGICISFQACGIDVEYPRAVTPLRRRLLEQGGLLLTEFRTGTSAFRQNFRIRNRLISAASSGTLVTQAPRISGALITAGWAREQGKDVFAVPGAVGDACSEGSNELLKDGARLVTNTVDILSEYLERYPFALDIAAAAAAERRASAKPAPAPALRTQHFEEPPRQAVAQPSAEEEASMGCPEDVGVIAKRVFASLGETPKTVSELARELETSSSEVLAALTELELFGAVSCQAGQRYVRSFT